MRRVLVPFEGEGCGVGELSWGQQEIWRAIRRYGNSLSLGGVTALPDGTTVEDVAASLGFLVGRHESLRTRLSIDEHGRALQVVADRGEIELEIVDAAEGEHAAPGADPAEIAANVFARLTGTNFDYENEWPVRMAVISDRGALTHMVAVYCHLALDQSGLDALVADLANRDPDTGRAARPVAGTPPLEQARQQQMAAGRRQSDTALRYWERMLRSIPARRFRDATDRTESGAGQYAEAHFTSPAVYTALTVINARSRTGTAAVLLAAYAVALARVTGRNPSVARVVVGNRFRPGFAESVSTVNRPGLCVVDVAGVGFDGVIARAARGSMNVYKHAYYDPVDRDELVATLSRERGEQIDLSCFFNDRRRPEPDTGGGCAVAATAATAQEIRDLSRHSVLDWVPEPEQSGERLFVHVEDLPGAVLFKARADTHHLPAAELEALLRGVETVLIEAVSDPDAATGVV